jgi:hypothetical protein
MQVARIRDRQASCDPACYRSGIGGRTTGSPSSAIVCLGGAGGDGAAACAGGSGAAGATAIGAGE